MIQQSLAHRPGSHPSSAEKLHDVLILPQQHPWPLGPDPRAGDRVPSPCRRYPPCFSYAAPAGPERHWRKRRGPSASNGPLLPSGEGEGRPRRRAKPAPQSHRVGPRDADAKPQRYLAPHDRPIASCVSITMCETSERARGSSCFGNDAEAFPRAGPNSRCTEREHGGTRAVSRRSGSPREAWSEGPRGLVPKKRQPAELSADEGRLPKPVLRSTTGRAGRACAGLAISLDG